MILKFFSNSSKSIFTKILFSAIILSFGLWGVGDIIRHVSETKTAISVGKYKISSEQLDREYSQMKQNIKTMGAKPLTEEEFNKMNGKEVILNNIIDKAVEEETIRQIGIIVPRKSLANIIYSLPEFQTNGVFNEKLYVSLLRQSGISESGLLLQIKNSIARNQLFHPIISGYKVPDFIRNKLGAVYESNKTIYVSILNVNDVKNVKEADEDTLKQYYENNKMKYKKPETRNIALLKMDYTKFIEEIQITEEEINDYYKNNKESFKGVETRDFERFEFSTKEEANNAHSKLAQDISDKVKEKLLANSQLLKEMKKEEFPNDVSKDIFNLKEGNISSVYTIGGKYYIYLLKKINAPVEKDISEIRKEIKSIIQNEKVNTPEFYSSIKEIKNKIDDSFAAGKDVDKVAKETRAEIIEIEDITKESDELIKQYVPDDETRKEIQETIFLTNENQASPIIESKEVDTVSYVVWVRKINKESIPELNKIKEEVKKDYVFEKKDKELTNIMDDMIENNKDILNQIKSLNNTKKFVIAKKDLMLQPDNKDIKKNIKEIIETLRSYEILNEILSTLHKEDSKYYKIANDKYAFVHVSDIEQPEQASNTVLYMIGQFLKNSVANDIVLLAKKDFKNRQNIKKYEKIIEERTKTVN
ncbi:MAG: SurA N-terminal domain-containing protein [Alphaproteobacteria bacterium]|nr:SurA N-terminal domain-containing protein [Alphaproteobacteria bacterium]